MNYKENKFKIISIIVTIILNIPTIIFLINNNTLVTKQIDTLERKENNTPKLNSASIEKIFNDQNNGKPVIIYSTGSTEVISINYGDNKEEKIFFFITLKNDSSQDYGTNSSGKFININITKMMGIINGYDLRNGDYIKKINLKIKKGGEVSEKIYFSLDKLFIDENGKYPSNIELFLTYNDSKKLENTDYEIVLLKSNIGIINSSGINNLIKSYYEKLLNTKIGFFGLQRVNNRNEKTFEYEYKDKFTENEIWYTQDRYLSLANYINEEFDNDFILKKLTIEECYEYIIDNRIEHLKDCSNNKCEKVRYKFDTLVLPSDDSICKLSNIILNIVK